MAALGGVVARRGAQAVGVAVLVSALCFLVVRRLPGDAAYRIAAGRYGYDLVDQQTAESVRAELGLDRPAWQQLGGWLLDLFQLDLGRSLVTQRPVTDEVGYYLLGTLQLTAVALLFATAVGGAAGVLAARRPGGVLDRVTTTWVAGVRAVPPFLLGLLLVVVFSAQLGLLPAVGHGSASSIVLPALTLGIGLSGLVARVTRDAVVEVRASDYVRFAQTKGLAERWVLLRHVVRNAAVVLVPYLGVQAVLLIEGVVVVESLFSWQGLGHALVHAVFWRDVPVLQATALVLALLIVAIQHRRRPPRPLARPAAAPTGGPGMTSPLLEASPRANRPRHTPHTRRIRGPRRAAAATLIGLAAFAVVAPLLLADPAAQDLSRYLDDPSLAEPLGRDEYGRSVLTRLAHATRLSLVLATRLRGHRARPRNRRRGGVGLARRLGRRHTPVDL